MSDLLTTLFGSAARKAVIAFLFSRPGESFYVTQIARSTGLAASNLSVELRRLAAAGIVETHKSGVERFYSANPRLPIFEELRSIAVKTSGVADILREALARISGVRLAFIYGSIASGEITPASDVDVMVVGDARFSDLVAALSEPAARLGREVSPRVYSEGELRDRAAAGGAFFAEVLAGEKIFLVGDEQTLRGIIGVRSDARPEEAP